MDITNDEFMHDINKQNGDISGKHDFKQNVSDHANQMSNQQTIITKDISFRSTAMQEIPNQSSSANSHDLSEDMFHGFKSAIVKIVQDCRNSEDYESQCLSDVEAVLEEAKELEKMLINQKDFLQQRIALIGKRLTQDI